MTMNFWGRRSIPLLACTALAGLAAPAMAQPATTAAAETADKGDADTILVIGTRRQDRSVLDSASPVDVVGAKELGTQPSSNVLDIVKNLVPSFFVGSNSISDASTFVRAPSLRGLSADEVLVMMNGKRFNRSALVQVTPVVTPRCPSARRVPTLRPSPAWPSATCRSCVTAPPRNMVPTPSPA
jgi:outer membrane receptor for ferrienterochelin and colicin